MSSGIATLPMSWSSAADRTRSTSSRPSPRLRATPPDISITASECSPVYRSRSSSATASASTASRCGCGSARSARRLGLGGQHGSAAAARLGVLAAPSGRGRAVPRRSCLARARRPPSRRRRRGSRPRPTISSSTSSRSSDGKRALRRPCRAAAARTRPGRCVRAGRGDRVALESRDATDWSSSSPALKPCRSSSAVKSSIETTASAQRPLVAPSALDLLREPAAERARGEQRR